MIRVDANTLQQKSHLCIPFLGIARPQPQFPRRVWHVLGLLHAPPLSLPISQLISVVIQQRRLCIDLLITLGLYIPSTSHSPFAYPYAGVSVAEFSWLRA
jgi:hypothetical protein